MRYVSGENDSFLAWVDEEAHYYTDHLVIHAVPWHFLGSTDRYLPTPEQLERSRMMPLWFLLGSLMSDSVVSYYRELYATGSLQGDYSHVYPETVKLLPVPRLDEPPAEAPPEWQERLRDLPRGQRAAEWLGRRFGDRSTVASVVAAAARRRQEIAFALLELERDFVDWMHATVGGGWRWGPGESLLNPPPLDVFNERLQGEGLRFAAYTEVRDTFVRLTDEAATLSNEAGLLQSGLNAGVAYLFRS